MDSHPEYRNSSEIEKAGAIAKAGTVEKALDVLFFLHRAGRAVGVSEVGRELQLPRSTAHRLLSSLRRRDLLERDERGHYRTGIGLVALGVGVLDREPIVEAARPVLQRAAREVGETLFLTAARAGRILVLEMAEGEAVLRAAPRVGSEIPVHATAVGRLYLGLAPEQVELPAGRLHAFTSRTVRSRESLWESAREAARRGYAVNREEWLPGLVVAAAPVLRRGRLEGAVAVAGPAARLTEQRTDKIVETLLAVSERVAARLAGRDA